MCTPQWESGQVRCLPGVLPEACVCWLLPPCFLPGGLSPLCVSNKSLADTWWPAVTVSDSAVTTAWHDVAAFRGARLLWAQLQAQVLRPGELVPLRLHQGPGAWAANEEQRLRLAVSLTVGQTCG